MAVEKVMHEEISGAKKAIEKDLKDAEASGPFMVAVFSVDSHGVLHCHRTTWKFPTGRNEEAVRLLRQLAEEECPMMSEPEPLPEADLSIIQKFLRRR